MSDIEALYERNTRFAKDFASADLPITPQLSTILLTCMDARIDPAHFMGLEPGEVLVMRNSGGRVSDDVERDIAIIWTLVAQMTGAAPSLSLAIIHHTDCGLEKFASPDIQQMVSQRSGLALSSLRQLAIVDHDSAFEQDVQRLKDSGIIPDGLIVSAHMYDPKSGRLHQTIAPTRLDQKEN